MNRTAETILLVDDDDNDQMLFRRALEDTGCPFHLVAMSNGAEALDYLTGEGSYTNRTEHPMPNVVFLDSLMPEVRGEQVLQFAKSAPSLHRIPVVILTGGVSPKEAARLYDLGANAVCLKPRGLKELRAFAQSVCDFWLRNTVSTVDS